MRHHRAIVAAAAALAAIFAALPAPARAQGKRLYAFGDSITTGLGDTGVECPTSTFGGYPARLEARLRGLGESVSVLNRGRCGESTAAGLTRIEEVLAEGGEIMLIMEGTNDISSPFISLQTIRVNLDEMARKATEAGLETIRSTVIPRDPADPGDTDNFQTEIVADLITEDAIAAGAVLADPFDAWIGIPDLYDTYYWDTIHPNPMGYTLLTDVLEAPALEAIDRYDARCHPGAETLCLSQERFEISVVWRDFQDRTGTGKALPLTPDTGSFYFFNPDNIELVIKVLDGRQRNGHFWVFYGALSNVEYTITVTDTVTGESKEYLNPSQNFGSVGDTQAFAVPPDPPAEAGAPAPLSEKAAVSSLEAALAKIAAKRRAAPAAAPPIAKGTAACEPDATSLCLNESRFRVEVTWKDFRDRTGVGQAIARTPDTGNFWFFREENIELIVKVLDGRPSNGHFWVFYGALSNVEYTITVTDTVTNESKEYFNPLSTFGSVGDTRAFEAQK